MRTNTRVVPEENVEIPTEGGLLSAVVRTPPEGDAHSIVVVHPATAVPQRLYTSFAGYLASRGFASVTYDYRGTGSSGHPRASRDVRMRDWMRHDVPAVAEWAAQRFPDLPALAVGHSIGGHALALDYGTDRLRGAVLIAVHAGVTRLIPDRAERIKVGAILNVAGPALSSLLGYMPGRRTGLGEDLPAAAMKEWGRWSRLPNYFYDDATMAAAERGAGVQVPLLMLNFSDDPWAVPAATDVIARHLTNAPLERRMHSPADAGVATIGHMGFFRSALEEPLWPSVADWLEARIAEPGPATAPGTESEPGQ